MTINLEKRIVWLIVNTQFYKFGNLAESGHSEKWVNTQVCHFFFSDWFGQTKLGDFMTCLDLGKCQTTECLSHILELQNHSWLSFHFYIDQTSNSKVWNNSKHLKMWQDFNPASFGFGNNRYLTNTQWLIVIGLAYLYYQTSIMPKFAAFSNCNWTEELHWSNISSWVKFLRKFCSN